MSNTMNCFSCGKQKKNIHLCNVRGGNQIICDECCKQGYQETGKCQMRDCPHKIHTKK